MKTQRPVFAPAALCFLLTAAVALGQGVPTELRTTTTNISQVMYYEPPHEDQIKLKFTGAEASPLPNGLSDIKKPHVLQYFTDGRLRAEAESPQCTYAILDNIASSTNHLALKLGDGKARLEGDGYLWRQSDDSLTISNNVTAVLKTGTWKMTLP